MTGGWADAVDRYCERLGPGLWAEPLNAASNLAFLVVAGVLWPRVAGRDRRLLVLLVGAVGLGSAVFHTVAERWAETLDVACIALYLLAYVAVFAHRVGGWRAGVAWTAAPLLALWTAVATAALPPPWRGLGMYLAAWTALWALAAWAARRRAPAVRPLVATALLFAASLALRQLDLPLCDRWPAGTHWAWHLLNAGVLAMSMRALGR
jgi:hypothetical protein